MLPFSPAPDMGVYANQINNAIGAEMRSRVAQSQNERDRAHEVQMKRMDQEALLAKLQVEQQMARERMASQERQRKAEMGIVDLTPHSFRAR